MHQLAEEAGREAGCASIFQSLEDQARRDWVGMRGAAWGMRAAQDHGKGRVLTGPGRG